MSFENYNSSNNICGRCIKTETIKNKVYYILKLSNCKIIRLDKDEILHEVLDMKRLKVTNLKLVANNKCIKLDIDSDYSHLYKYTWLFDDSKEKRDEANKLDAKARLLNMCPIDTEGNLEKLRFNGNVLITDNLKEIPSNNLYISGNLTFKGSMPLDVNTGITRFLEEINKITDTLSDIHCERANIFNRCVMANLNTTLEYSPHIVAHEYVIKHEFVDLYTASEILQLLSFKYNYSAETQFYAPYLVDFKSANIDYDSVLKLALEEENKLNYALKQRKTGYFKYGFDRSANVKIYAFYSWLLSMFMSTECKVNELLNITIKYNEYMKDNFGKFLLQICDKLRDNITYTNLLDELKKERHKNEYL